MSILPDNAIENSMSMVLGVAEVIPTRSYTDTSKADGICTVRIWQCSAVELPDKVFDN